MLVVPCVFREADDITILFPAQYDAACLLWTGHLQDLLLSLFGHPVGSAICAPFAAHEVAVVQVLASKPIPQTKEEEDAGANSQDQQRCAKSGGSKGVADAVERVILQRCDLRRSCHTATM